MILEVGVSSDEKIGEEQARVQFAQACGTPAALFSLQRGGQDHRSNIEDRLPTAANRFGGRGRAGAACLPIHRMNDPTPQLCSVCSDKVGPT